MNNLGEVRSDRDNDGHSKLSPDNLNQLHSATMAQKSQNAANDGPALASLSAADPPPPIAIVGMGMRLPAKVRTADDFWKLLIDGKDGYGPVPKSRYDTHQLDNDASNTTATSQRGGYFLEQDLAHFDAPFFNISSRHAALTDPQQRLLQEVAYECLENGGQTKFRGRDIGCFVGVFGNDWLELGMVDKQNPIGQQIISSQDFVVANQVSQGLDITGPSVTFKTGCSSSMTALHHACQALYAGECSAALVGGASIQLTPTLTESLAACRAVSSDGSCKTFDADADGYGRGDGINMILLKKLDDAMKDGDTIRAVIRATAANADGKQVTAAMPNGKAQELVIRKAYKKAAISDFSKTAFVECHGTGTQKGDITEAAAIASVFEGGIIIGAVKPNFGHSEGASGITSIIKAVLALENKSIPPNIHMKTPNPQIPFEAAGLIVPLKHSPWPKGCAERISVNGMGAGGSNVHVILESAASVIPTEPVEPIENGTTKRLPWQMIPISANSATSLQGQIKATREYMKLNPGNLHDLAYTLGCRRNHYSHRSFILSDGSPLTPINDSKQSQPTQFSSVAFVFTGQGSQWSGMGKSLMEHIPSFRDDVRSMDAALQRLPDPPTWRLQSVFDSSQEEDFDDTELAQSLCTAVQLGLVNVLSTWGVSADSVVGHSSGELAAAYCAGAISADLAIVLSYYRGKAIQSHSPRGAMAAVGLGKDLITPLLSGDVIIACENSPENVTLAGNTEHLDRVLEQVASKHPDTPSQRLHVKTAYHTSSMERAAAEYEKLISAHLHPNECIMKPMYSSILGRPIDRTTNLDAAYWRTTITSPVLFNSAVNSLVSDAKANTLFVEIGPHSALLGPMREILRSCRSEFELDYTPTLIREQDEIKSLLSAAGQLYSRQVPLTMSAVNGSGTMLTNLPPYSWQHDQRYWMESRMGRAWRHGEFAQHELLGSRTLESTDREPSWRNCLKVENILWILDHDIAGEIVFPCAGYICMLGEAIRQLTGISGYVIRELFVRSAMVLQRKALIEVVTNLKPVQLTDVVDSTWYNFTVSSFDGKKWQKHCVGQIRGREHDTDLEISSIKYPFARRIDSERWYKTMADHGVRYGKHFRGLCNISSSPLSYEAVADLESDEGTAAAYLVHPTMVDQGFQLLGVASCKGLSRNLHTLGVPFSVEEVQIASTASAFRLEANFSETCDGSLDIASGGRVMATSNGRLAFEMKGAKFFPLRYQAPDTDTVPLASRVEWKPDLDLLPSRLLVSPSMVQTKQMGLIAKMVILAADQWSDSMGIASLDSMLRIKFDQLKEENVGRIRDNLQTILPNEDDWNLDHGVCRPKYLKDITNAIKGVDTALKPLRGFLKTFLEMLEGRIQPLAYSLQDNGFPTVYDFISTVFYLGHPLSLMGHSNPALRVLEIGSNKFGTTSALLSCLHSNESVALFSKFVFASQSPQLLEEANERFGDIAGFESQMLDLDADVTTQGLGEACFDFIMAPYDLPALFDDFSKSLSSIMRLLKPGGRFMVHEITPPVPAADYFMAAPPVAAIFGDRVRSKVPFPPDFWTKALREHGYADINSYTSAEYGNSWSSKVTISSVKSMPARAKGDIDLVCIDKSHQWIQNVEQNLQNAGYTTHFHTMHAVWRVPERKADAIVLLDLEDAFLKDISVENYDALIKYLSQRRRTLWITRPAQMNCSDPSHGLVLGLARTARYELNLDFATLEIDVLDADAAGWVVKVYDKFTRQPGPGKDAPDTEFALQKGIVHVPRFHWMPLVHSSPDAKATKHKDSPVALTIGNPPSLEALCWKHASLRSPESNEVEIDVHFVGLNFRDIMVSAGVISDGQGLGLEASGVVRRVGANVKGLKKGDRVSTMGAGLLCTRVMVPEHHCFAVPEELSLSEAATMPVAHSTASYSLQVIGQLERDQSVLIHSACGAVGQAAIQVCQAVGAQIYATVGSEIKAAYLVEAYGIPRESIFHSRDASFVANVLRATNGVGCHIVLNSLSGELLHESWKCVANFGKMIELGKRDFLGHGSLKMQPFGGNRSFIGIDMLKLAGTPERFRKVKECVANLGKRRQIRPIQPVRKFKSSQVQEALAYMQRGTHLGKILIDMKSDGSRPTVDGDDMTVTLSSNASYLLVGGLGGIGRAICSWMVERGAQHLTLLSRSSGSREEDQVFLDELRAQGCEATTVAGDVSNIGDVQRAITSSSKPILGVIHLGMVLKSMSLLRCPHEDWRAVQSPKVDGAWNLHNALVSRKLDFFVVFSSISSLCGAVGQANYASANAFLDALIKYRRSLNLPAAGINLGAIGDIGCFLQMPSLVAAARSSGVRFLNEKEVLRSLQVAIKVCQDGKDAALESSQVIAGMSTSSASSISAFRPAWSEDARFRLYARLQQSIGMSYAPNISDDDKAFLNMARNHPDRLNTAAAEETLLRIVARRVLGPDADEVQQSRFKGMLVDSFVGIEITGWLRRNLGLEISMADVVGTNTMESFCKLALQKYRGKKLQGETDSL